MNGNVCLPDKSKIARAILTYLADHPDAQDTLEGIAQSWMPDQGNKFKPIMVQEVVKDLVLEGTILETKMPGSQTVYRLNLAKRDRTKETVNKMREKG